MIRAHITTRYFNDAVNVWIVRHQDGFRRVMHMTEDGGTRWDDLGRDDEAVIGDPEPTLVLPDDSGRALLEALVQHYQGAEDTRALRRDYDNERKRVDEQAKTIADIARLLAQGGSRG